MSPARPALGATLEAGGVRFRVWAPTHDRVELVLYTDAGKTIGPLEPEDHGYWSTLVPGLGAGARYKYRLNGEGPFPDPASRFQPEGVHGPSAVVDPAFPWTDEHWLGLPLEELILYEAHVGTATPEGTFEALIPRLAHLRDLGITALELMPVADFPGGRNWGYDGVSLWAPSRAYGGPEGLRRLVNAAHDQGLAVLLDVVYNHLGPDGNYLWAYSRDYFTSRHKTPWGDALNFDGPNSGPVRDFFVSNALHWLTEYHLDGLRLDATHAILDTGERHLLRELAETVREVLGPDRYAILVAEDERNEASLARPVGQGGLGLDAVWADDFHHQIRRALAGDTHGYYAHYSGLTRDLARTLEEGWFFTGQARPGDGLPRGTLAGDLLYPAFVHCIQNHDQIGNRALGERLNHEISLAAYRAASALLLLDPATPLLFMGQEWAASSPFLFFTDHHPELGHLVTEGRRREFAAFPAFADEATRTAIPDPQAPGTFARSKLDWLELEREPHAGVLRLYRDLIALRRAHPALLERSRSSVAVAPLGSDALALRRTGGGAALLAVVNLRGRLEVNLGALELAAGRDWTAAFSSESGRYGGGEGARLEGSHLTADGPAAAVLEGEGYTG